MLGLEWIKDTSTQTFPINFPTKSKDQKKRKYEVFPLFHTASDGKLAGPGYEVTCYAGA